MGIAKAALEWHGSTLLRRVTGVIERVVEGPVVVVRAPGQRLPALPASTLVCEDGREGRGPLQGLAAGLALLDGRAELAFVSATDLPLLHPAFVRAVLNALDGADGADAAVPSIDGRRQPLAAAYRTSVRVRVAELLAAGRQRLGELLERLQVRELDRDLLLADARLASCDPSLDSLLNLNEAADYRAARRRAAPPVSVELAERGVHRQVLAATLAEALAAVGLPAPAGDTLLLNGERVAADPELPLSAGDLLRLMAVRAR